MAKKLTANEAKKVEENLALAKKMMANGDVHYFRPATLKLFEKCFDIVKENGAVLTEEQKDEPAPAAKPKRTTDNLDEFHYPILTKDKIRRIAESMIPQKFRPFYLGCEIEKAYCHPHPWTADNCDIYLYFSAPVVGMLSDARHVHCNLDGLLSDIGQLEIDESSKGAEEYEEYDEEHAGKPVVKIPEGKAILDGWKKVEFVEGFEIPCKR